MNNFKHIFMMNKKRINKRLLPLLLGGLLMTTACSNENVWSYDGGKADDGEYVDVNFSVNPQNELATRATVESGKYVPTIAQGKQVDMLIYAVYEVVRNENEDSRPVTAYNHLAQYGTENGQTIVKDPFKKEDGNVGKYTTTLRLMRNKEYAIAFWAQSSKAKDVYNTSDLTKVTVNYKNAENNDELRDAFCKVEMFTVSPNQNINVILQRPLAQINVGTTGADYYNHLYLHNDQPVLYSSITLTGVANCINVVEDKIYSTEGFGKTVTFTPAKIAAYWDIEDIENSLSKNSEYDLDLILGSDDPDAEGSQAGSTTNTPTAKYLEKEEFLMINLDGHPQQVKHEKDINSMGYLQYKTAYPTLDKGGEFLTETFKYISMCYVLVPASLNAQEGKTVDQYYSSTLSEVKIEMYNSKKGFRTLTVNEVPVHRNWRTNILGGLYKEDRNRPDDDPGPDDPSSFFSGTVNARIYLSPTYEGEYNSKDEGNSWHQDTYGDNQKTDE